MSRMSLLMAPAQTCFHISLRYSSDLALPPLVPKIAIPCLRSKGVVEEASTGAGSPSSAPQGRWWGQAGGKWPGETLQCGTKKWERSCGAQRRCKKQTGTCRFVNFLIMSIIAELYWSCYWINCCFSVFEMPEIDIMKFFKPSLYSLWHKSNKSSNLGSLDKRLFALWTINQFSVWF